ncbi:MAG: hypothetical protein U0350_14235 [Caldilineaceae bacterium]
MNDSNNAPFMRRGAWFKPLLGAFFLLVLLLTLTKQTSAQSCPLYPPDERFGVNVDTVNGMRVEDYEVAQLKAYWYVDYRTQITPTHPAGLQYAQMIRGSVWRSRNFTQTLTAAIKANPGALWFIGNEPDRDGQDGLLPADYAVFYHDAYTFLKQHDANSRVAMGAVVQGTPIRLRYLNMVLDAYQAHYGASLPTDLWTVHGFILPECKETGCWGASIPPGLDAFKDEGKKYTVTDHGDIEIFKEHIMAFRQWMAAHGYRDKPLIVSEYGILLSPYHGFPYSVVRTYMLATFDFFLNATDSTIGDPADQNRLVQSWSWFSLNSPPYDLNTGKGFNGNLFNPTTRQIELLGQDYAAYVTNVTKNYVDVNLSEMQVSPSVVMSSTMPTITVSAKLLNIGGRPAHQVAVQLWLNSMNRERTLLGQTTLLPTLDAGCTAIPIEFQWRPETLAIGTYTLSLEVQMDSSTPDANVNDNSVQQQFFHLDKPFSNFIYLPEVKR